MKNSSLLLSVINSVIILSFIVYTLVFNNQKIVYVDSAQLLNGYKGMQDARKAYEVKAKTWKANIDTLTQDVQKQIMIYEKSVGTMTVKERSLSQELIKTKQRTLNTQAQQEDGKMTGEVVSQVNAYLKKYGEKHSYKIIIAATQYGNLAYADEGLDITKDVLEGLNNEYAGK